MHACSQALCTPIIASLVVDAACSFVADNRLIDSVLQYRTIGCDAVAELGCEISQESSKKNMYQFFDDGSLLPSFCFISFFLQTAMATFAPTTRHDDDHS